MLHNPTVGLTLVRAAARALGRLDWQPPDERAAGAYWAARENWEKCIEIGPPAVEPLARRTHELEAVVLADARKPARERSWGAKDRFAGAVKALARIGNRDAAEALLEVLHRDRWEGRPTREMAAEALGEIGWATCLDIGVDR